MRFGLRSLRLRAAAQVNAEKGALDRKLAFDILKNC